MEGNKRNIKHSIKAELAANQWVCAAPDMTGSWPLRNKEKTNTTTHYLLVKPGSENSSGKLHVKLKVYT